MQMLVSVDGVTNESISLGGLFVSGTTRDFLNDVGTTLEKQMWVLQIRLRTDRYRSKSGCEDGPLGTNSRATSLDQLQASDPSKYASVIADSNKALNATGARGRCKACSGLTRLRQGDRSSTKGLGGKIDFANQDHREAIGNAIIQHVRQTGGCDVAGTSLSNCK